MTWLAMLWFLQDFVQVFLMGFFIVPNIYLMTLLLMAFARDREGKTIMIIWAALSAG